MFNGRPFIAGTHISVSFVLKQFAQGSTIKDIARLYPQIRADDIINAIKYAVNIIDAQTFTEDSQENKS